MRGSSELSFVVRALGRLSPVRGPDLLGTIRSARSIAFVAGAPQHANTQRWIRSAENLGVSVDILSLGEPSRRVDGRPTSFIAAPTSVYDCVVVHEGVELFEHSWSYAFLDRLNAFTSDGGTILVPKGDWPGFGISATRLMGLFGGKPEKDTSSHLTFRKVPGPLERPSNAQHSTLDAYWPLMDTLTYGQFNPRLANTIRALGITRVERPPREVDADYASVVHKQAYRTCSVRTKAALTEYIVSVYFSGRSGLRMADLGAGTGLNSLELLLNPGQISSVTLVEPRRGYHWHIAALVEEVRALLRGPVFLVDQKVEEFTGPENDIGLVCGVLVMVPEDRRQRFIASAWNNLAPGGILIVLENMRSSTAAANDRYNSQRCTPSEIDSLLRGFAPIRYFMSSAKRELPFRQVGNDTVFRVIQKPE